MWSRGIKRDLLNRTKYSRYFPKRKSVEMSRLWSTNNNLYFDQEEEKIPEFGLTMTFTEVKLNEAKVNLKRFQQSGTADGANMANPSFYVSVFCVH